MTRLPQQPICVFLCDRTGIAAHPWASTGYECWCVDIQHSIRRERVEGLVHYVWGDVRSWLPPARPIAFMGCFPPCTHVAVSGARDFKAKGLMMLADALTIFNACQLACAYSGAPYFIENPVGVLSSHIRKPDYAFHPCDYAGYADDPASEGYTKRTCLWTGGGFVMPPAREVPAIRGSMMHLLPPSDERSDLRSATPKGFARAVFEANHQLEARASA